MAVEFSLESVLRRVRKGGDTDKLADKRAAEYTLVLKWTRSVDPTSLTLPTRGRCHSPKLKIGCEVQVLRLHILWPDWLRLITTQS
jgi:hypothetical protein